MAVHALALLAQSDEGHASEYIAGSVNTHAVALRRVLRRLADAGLIEAREGRGGGYRLARPAERIWLDEVYRAVEGEGPLAPSPARPNPRCSIGAGIAQVFAATAAAARQGVEGALSRQNVAGVARAALEAGCTPAARRA
jgi:Rrf2 family protein